MKNLHRDAQKITEIEQICESRVCDNLSESEGKIKMVRMKLKILVLVLLIIFPTVVSAQVKVRIFANQSPESAIFTVYSRNLRSEIYRWTDHPDCKRGTCRNHEVQWKTGCKKTKY